MKCAYKNCNNDFTPKTHNQKYCSDECCKIATNEKIREAYYEKKARLAGKKRVCKKCTTILSRYNEYNVCSKCMIKEKADEKKLIMEAIKNVTGKTF